MLLKSWFSDFLKLSHVHWTFSRRTWQTEAFPTSTDYWWRRHTGLTGLLLFFLAYFKTRRETILTPHDMRNLFSSLSFSPKLAMRQGLQRQLPPGWEMRKSRPQPWPMSRNIHTESTIYFAVVVEHAKVFCFAAI